MQESHHPFVRSNKCTAICEPLFLSKCLDISINKGRIISYVSFNALRLFGIIGIYKISHKNSETVYDHAIPLAGKITVSFAVWFILYSDFHGEKARKVCTIVTRGAYTSQSPMDLHRCTNSFGNRSGARIIHTHIRTYIHMVSTYRHLQIADARRVCAALLYAPKLVCTWYRPRDRMTRFNALSLARPSRFFFRFRLFLLITALRRYRGSRESL